MLERRLRAAHDDALDIVRSEWPTRLHEPDGVERRVIGADAGIEFERDAHRLETLAKTGGEFGPVEAILRAREGRAEPAIRALEDISDAGEATLGEEGAVETALRRATGMHALDHSAVLRRHQTGRLRAGDAERMDHLVDR